MATNITPEFLRSDEEPMVDTSVDSLVFYEIKLANPDTEDNPRFTIDYTDQWVLPKEAYLQMTGEIVKAVDGSSYGAADNVALVNNGPLYLFDWTIYKIDNQAVEIVEKPGEASLVTSLVDYTDDYVNSMGEQLMIAKDTKDNDTANTNTGY